MELDLTEAVEAGTRAMWSFTFSPHPYDDSGSPEDQWCENTARAVLSAAAPILERQVREKIAQEIEASRLYIESPRQVDRNDLAAALRDVTEHHAALRALKEHHARIARGPAMTRLFQPATHRQIEACELCGKPWPCDAEQARLDAQLEARKAIHRAAMKVIGPSPSSSTEEKGQR